MPPTFPYAVRSPGALLARLRSWFGWDDRWQRPTPAIGWSDVGLFAAMEFTGLFLLELVRSLGALDQFAGPRWAQWLAVSSGALLLLFRRRFPMAIGALAATHMFVTGVTMPAVMGQVAMQVVYFVALLSMVAWARDRRAVLALISGIVVLMFVWVSWQMAWGSGTDSLISRSNEAKREGLFSPVLAAVLLTLAINVAYFVGAIVGGQVAWRAARQRAALVKQSNTIQEQSERLQQRAIVDERLRIARELHDVVGHHVSVIGVQAGAARRVLDVDADAAKSALGVIEGSSRSAVAQMRSLLGTLRDMESLDEGEDRERGVTSDLHKGNGRAPEPALADVATLISEHEAHGLQVALQIVESRPGALGALPAPVSLSLYRIVQEALSNVIRHSTASEASVVVRIDADRSRYAEVEILDAGRLRTGTSGSGLGQLGIRERASSHRGQVEIGPRATGGYRVRVRIPLGENDE